MTSEGNTGDESRERQRRGRGREEEVGRGGESSHKAATQVRLPQVGTLQVHREIRSPE